MSLLLNPTPFPSHITALLSRLHARSSNQESTLSRSVYDKQWDPSGDAEFHSIMRDKFIALDQDKCHVVYQLIRATGARSVIEAGTSFGVSTIYLALGVGDNARAAAAAAAGDGDGEGDGGKVIATENEPSKAETARKHWEEAGQLVSDYIELREGNLLETLKVDMPTVDLLLLDIWTPLALPTLRVVQPHMRAGALIIADNIAVSGSGYAELLEYMRAPGSGFSSITLPYTGGLLLSVYTPPPSPSPLA